MAAQPKVRKAAIARSVNECMAEPYAAPPALLGIAWYYPVLAGRARQEGEDPPRARTRRPFTEAAVSRRTDRPWERTAGDQRGIQCAFAAEHPREEGDAMRFLRDQGLAITMFGIFAVTMVGLVLTGWNNYNGEQIEHSMPTITLTRYLTTPSFGEAVFENWE